MATKPRRRYSHAQARNNIMRRAIEEIVDPGPTSIDSLWEWFGAQCAYCGAELVRGARDAHTDHAESGAGNHLGNLVLACGRCNGDEKRDMNWRTFLTLKAVDPTTLAVRERRILDWIAANPRPIGHQGRNVARREECSAAAALNHSAARPPYGRMKRWGSSGGRGSASSNGRLS